MDSNNIEEQLPVFNEQQMLRLVQKDANLTFVFKDLSIKSHDKAHLLEVIFNSNVLEDSLFTNEYEACSNLSLNLC
jgi:hypothetical protein